MISLHSPRRLPLPALAGLLTAILSAFLAACQGEKVAGGATGIENPGIMVAFQDERGSLPVTGTLRIYDQRSGWLDSSIYSRPLVNQDTAHIHSRDLEVLLKTLPGDSLAKDSILEFNVVVSGTDLEGILGGYRLKGSRSRGFTFEKSPASPDTSMRAKRTMVIFDGACIKADLLLRPPVFLYPGLIVSSHLDKGINVVFIPGSPYGGWVNESGSLVFPILPQGTFPVRAASVFMSPVGNAIKVYCTPDSLSTFRPFAPKRWEECED